MNPASSVPRFTNYDVSSYTDGELLNILSLSEPTDRELEARIIQMIHKYNSGEPTSNRYQQFFMDIYERFFEVGDDDDAEDAGDDDDDADENIVEGMVASAEPPDVPEEPVADTELQPSPTTAGTDVNNAGIPTKIDDKVALTRPLDYSKDQMNPLLKQVIRRTVSIDSQYRNRKFHGMSTNFSFNLSEPLRDVVSLKLYSIQIPYSWYTINNSYGANIIYVKGNAPGINNGDYDYSFGIPVGNYNQKELIDAINSGISTTMAQRMDVSFGMGNFFSYNNSTVLTTANIYINNTFNENNYSMVFTDPGYVNNTITVEGKPYYIDRYGNSTVSGKLNAFLGFNNSVYDIDSVYSQRNFPGTTGKLDNVSSTIIVDSSNNIIRLVQYTNTNTNNYTIDNSLNEIDIVIPSGSYTQQELYDQVNVQINNNPYLDKTVSGLSIIPITDPLMANYGSSYFKLSLRVLRNSTAFVSGDASVRTAVILPDDTRVWLSSVSLFSFDISTNELNVVRSETNSIENDFNSNPTQFFLLRCKRPGYENNKTPSQYANISYTTGNISSYHNDIKVSLGNVKAYTLNAFINSINTQIGNVNNISKSLNSNNTNGVFNLTNTKAYVEPTTNTFRIQFDMNNKFTNTDYYVTFGDMLYNAFNYVNVSLNAYSGNAAISSFPSTSINIEQSLLISDGNGGPAKILTVYPNPNSYNAGDVSWNVYLFSSAEINQTAQNIQSAITNFSYTTSYNLVYYPMQKSTVSYDNTTSIITVNLYIENVLSQNDYELIFYDGTGDASWNQVKVYTYNTNQYIYSLTTNTPVADVSGYEPIPGTNFNLHSDTTLQINCTNGAIDAANNIIITIPANTYTRNTLISKINSQFDSNPLTKGSYISYYTTASNQDFIYFKFNIAKVYNASNYLLVLYDVVSFVKCYVGASSVRNTSWDSTLGWTLGYRNTEYDLSAYYNTSTRSSIIVSETALNVYPYNYFYIILDDYNQSRLNDGLVTLSLSENIIAQPSYAPKQSFVCDASGNKVFIGSDSQPLTTNQKWSANQIYLDSQTVKSKYSSTPFIKDVFGIVPIKPGSAGSNYVEFGGSLQNQERLYFGPVTIYRMNIQLMDNKGDIVDLNGSEWSFSFICEQLYRSDAGGS